MVTVRGCSDDCINVNGDIYEWFEADPGEYPKIKDWLAFSDGTILKPRLDKKEVWHFDLIRRGWAYIRRKTG